MVEILKRCGNDLTRKNAMTHAASLPQMKVAMLRPGITISTTPTNYNLFKKLQMLTFDGKNLVPSGAPIAAE